MQHDKPVRLVAMLNPPTSQYAENWRHPLSRGDWLSADFYVELGRTLERGCFDMAFLPDALAVPEDHRGDYATTLRTGGKGSIYLDPMVTLSMLAAGTTHLGLSATLSTTIVPPYAIARSMLSLDHLSGGRVAWNIVTSTTDAEARNFGLDAIPDRGSRYDRADRVVQTVVDLWEGWEPDALRLDPDARVFADPDAVSRVPIGDGEPPLARGPITLPRSPQGRPVLMQAGSSPRGLAFAARWAEVVFAVADSAASMRAMRTEIRDRARSLGRDPDELVFLPAVQPVIGASTADARNRLADLVSWLDDDEVLTKLGRLLHAENLDPAGSAAAALVAHRGATGSEGFEQMLLSAATRGAMTVLDLARSQALNQLHPMPVGDPAGVADELLDLVDTGAADGFVVMPALYPSSITDVVDGLVPELQRRGRFRRSYAPGSLRERLRTGR